MEPKMRVLEVFTSVDGEGVFQGYPATFVRFVGCNLHCKWCDTEYSWAENVDVYETRLVEPSELAKEVHNLGITHVTLTGGEPTLQPELEVLVRLLVAEGHIVNVETNGTVGVPDWAVKYQYVGRCVWTMDWKCSSSGQSHLMAMDRVRTLTHTDVLKFVVADEIDMYEALAVVNELDQRERPMVFLSPVFGSVEPKQIVEFMLANGMDDCRVQLQLHKVIWEPETRGV